MVLLPAPVRIHNDMRHRHHGMLSGVAHSASQQRTEESADCRTPPLCPSKPTRLSATVSGSDSPGLGFCELPCTKCTSKGKLPRVRTQ